MSVAFLSSLYSLSTKRRVMVELHTTALTENVFEKEHSYKRDGHLGFRVRI